MLIKGMVPPLGLMYDIKKDVLWPCLGAAVGIGKLY